MNTIVLVLLKIISSNFQYYYILKLTKKMHSFNSHCKAVCLKISFILWIKNIIQY